MSLGILHGKVLTDLCYVEDSKAETDLNLVARGDGSIVEIQGTAEGVPMSRADLDAIVDQGLKGIAQLCALQKETLGAIWP